MRLDSRGCGKTHKGTRFVEEGRFGAWGSSSIEKEFSPVQVVQLEEISDVIPVLPIRSDGLIRSLGRSAVAFTVSGKSWYPEVYELTAAPVHKIQIWTSPEGLLLAADRPRTPKSRIALVRFQQFAEF